jgi:hypothetical protein
MMLVPVPEICVIFMGHDYFAFQLICPQNRQQEQLNLFFF